jgi:hypothetical protein
VGAVFVSRDERLGVWKTFSWTALFVKGVEIIRVAEITADATKGCQHRTK